MWYQLRGGGTSSPEHKSFSLAGGHDFDGAWVSDVRNGVGGRWKGTGDTDATKVKVKVYFGYEGACALDVRLPAVRV